MKLRRHLVVMAKLPQRGRVKRRLAAEIGADAALSLYRRMLARLLRRLGGDPRWHCWLYIAPDRAVRRSWRWPGRWIRRPQGRGDLGARMRRPFRELAAGPVVIIGSDIPGIARHHIAAAFRRLGSHDLVFGPARDGGYWLVGARRRPHAPRLFHAVRWSSRHALADTLAGLNGHYRIAMLEELEDIDDGASLARLLAGEKKRGPLNSRA